MTLANTPRSRAVPILAGLVVVIALLGALGTVTGYSAARRARETAEAQRAMAQESMARERAAADLARAAELRARQRPDAPAPATPDPSR